MYKLRKPKRDWLKFPQVIHVDTTNKCGSKHCGILCSYCFPQWWIAQGKDFYADMPMEWIDWILKEVKRDGKTLRLLAWFFNGDGLCEPRLPEILKKSKKTVPWARTQTFTCGSLTKNIDLLINRNLDMAAFTVSAHTKELYKKVHRGDRFDNVIETLKIWLENKHPNQDTEIHLVLTNDNYCYAQDWWDYFSELTEGYDRVKLIISPIVYTKDNIPAMEVTSKIDMDLQDKIVLDVAGAENRMWMRHLTPDLKPCNVFDDCTITSHGDFLQCCNWCNYETWNYGNIEDLIKEDRPLRDVWMAKLANKLRNPICDSCNQKHSDWLERVNAYTIKAV